MARLGLKYSRKNLSRVTSAPNCVKRRPSHLDIFFQGVKSVREPYIDIDNQRTGTYSAKCSSAKGDGMIPKSPIKVLVE